MGNAERFREYAAECDRLSKTASLKDRAALLEIAHAWIAVAEEAERKEKEAERHQEEALDDALKNTFPASDPFSIEPPDPPDTDGD